MPYAAPQVCPRCRKTYAGKRCPCTPASRSSSRSPSAKAGSSRAMRKLRTTKLDNNPKCEWPECGRPAAQVDHIKPVAQHPELALDWDNLQSLCRPHHVEKTNADRRRRSGKPDDDD
jgi:5-methylcytosine-specific restriction enzyme A